MYQGFNRKARIGSDPPFRNKVSIIVSNCKVVSAGKFGGIRVRDRGMSVFFSLITSLCTDAVESVSQNSLESVGNCHCTPVSGRGLRLCLYSHNIDTQVSAPGILGCWYCRCSSEAYQARLATALYTRGRRRPDWNDDKAG